MHTFCLVEQEREREEKRSDVSSLDYIFHSRIPFSRTHKSVLSSPCRVALLHPRPEPGEQASGTRRLARHLLGCAGNQVFRDYSFPRTHTNQSSHLRVELLSFIPVPNLCAHRDRDSRPPELDALRAHTPTRVCGQSGFWEASSTTACYLGSATSATSWR